MRSRSSVCLALLVVLLAACTRARPALPPSATALPLAPSPAAVGSLLAIEAPSPGALVASPVSVSGKVSESAGRTLAVVVYRTGPGGALEWCGNGPLALDDGTFSGTVDYTLAAPAQGVVEVMLVDPTGGAVIARQSVPVALAPAP